MIISLRSIAGMRLEIQPDPAIVHVGDRVEWQLIFLRPERGLLTPRRDPFRFGPLKWTVYFRREQPFGRRGEHEISAPAALDEPARIGFGTAETPGDYKYGVRLVDATGEEVSDDDPFLIVLP